jgi:formate-dependent nitrite reductase membrane component NrfD
MAYGFPMAALTAEQAWADAPFIPPFMRRMSKVVPVRLLGLLGVPCSLMLSTYPGVLLSTTANPLWSRSRALGALFACTSIHAGATAVGLALKDAHTDERARIERIEAVSAAAEAAALAAFLVGTGAHARPLVRGRIGALAMVGAVGAGMLLPALLKALAPKRGRMGKAMRVAGAVLSLAGSFAFKAALIYAGHEAARDARSAHRAAAS